MRKFFWILGGALFVSSGFWVGGGAEKVWVSLLSTGCATGIFIFCFITFQRKSDMKLANMIGTVSIFLLVLYGLYGWMAYQHSTKQRALLDEIRLTIESGIAKSQINKMLLQTLKSYSESEESDVDLGAMFHSRYDSVITERVIEYNQQREDRSPSIELVKASADSVILVAYADFAEGKQVDFSNYNGGSGKFQARGILTKQGIGYEREN